MVKTIMQGADPLAEVAPNVDSRTMPEGPDIDTLCVVPGCFLPRKEWSGRGRHPIKCEIHTQSSRKAPPASHKTASNKGPSDDDIRQSLEDCLALIAMGMMAAHLKDTPIVLASSSDLATAMVAVGHQYPSVRRVLIAMTSMGSGITSLMPLTVVVANIGVAVAVNHGAELPDMVQANFARYIPTTPSDTQDHDG